MLISKREIFILKKISMLLLSILTFFLIVSADVSSAVLNNADFVKLCITGSMREIEEALAEGANANAFDETLNASALMIAANYQDDPMAVKILIKYGARINDVNKYGVTALMWAAQNSKNPEVIRVLIDNGANMKLKDNQGYTARDYAAKNKSRQNITDFFTDAAIEGPGFATPEEAVWSYLTAFKEVNLDKMISAFAIESYVDNYDYKSLIEPLKSYSVNFEMPAPNTNIFLRDLNVEFRRGYLIRQIFFQYILIFAPDIVPYGLSVTRVEIEIPEFIAKFGGPEQTEKMKSLKVNKVVKAEQHPLASHPRYYDTRNMENISRWSKTRGQAQIEQFVGDLEIDRRNYIMFFEVALYNNKWYISTLGGNMAALNNLPFNSGGVILVPDLLKE
ncbi:MAG: ankyrin repeat domain-containing protein [Synergistaceae bacterium]|jgi:hypothetical protein|nr:ankyrin repeat domain-containing protein [Synergistaceae bacterium]